MIGRRKPPARRRGSQTAHRPDLAEQSITVLGVDPGLECTGYAVVHVPLGRVVDAGLIRTRADRSLAERLREIDAGLHDVLSEHETDLLAVEDLYSHYKHPRTAILMGHARGIVLLAAARRSIEVISVSATQIKKSLTGNGHASKLQVQRAIMAVLSLEVLPEPADVADALAVAVCAGRARLASQRFPTDAAAAPP
jgi:crossover junction endodeoxyribonuclease RuvC